MTIYFFYCFKHEMLNGGGEDWYECEDPIEDIMRELSDENHAEGNKAVFIEQFCPHCLRNTCKN